MKAAKAMLQAGIDAISDRSEYRDEGGKTSLALTASIFSALTGNDFNERDACLFLAIAKLARSQQGKFHHDDYVDAAAYIALAGEAHADQVRPGRKVWEAEFSDLQEITDHWDERPSCMGGLRSD